MLAVRCYACGNILGNKGETYVRLLEDLETELGHIVHTAATGSGHGGGSTQHDLYKQAQLRQYRIVQLMGYSRDELLQWFRVTVAPLVWRLPAYRQMSLLDDYACFFALNILKLVRLCCRAQVVGTLSREVLASESTLPCIQMRNTEVQPREYHQTYTVPTSTLDTASGGAPPIHR